MKAEPTLHSLPKLLSELASFHSLSTMPQMFAIVMLRAIRKHYPNFAIFSGNMIEPIPKKYNSRNQINHAIKVNTRLLIKYF